MNQSTRRRKPTITVAQVVDTALDLVAAQGYDALTMRRLATVFDTGPASLYAHVASKAALDELLIARLCAGLVLPEPDRPTWRAQIRDVCGQLRDQYLRYPGISRAALAIVPTDQQIVRVAEGMLGILLAGGIAPQAATWAVDALLLYVAAYGLETSTIRRRAEGNNEGTEGLLDPAELRRQFTALPADTFPHSIRHAAELTSGAGHERFDFTLTLMINGLTAPQETVSQGVSQVSDVAWAQIEPLLPAQYGNGRPFRDHRQVIEGILYRFREGIAWRELPEEFGPWQTAWKRYQRFAADGTWDKIAAILGAASADQPTRPYLGDAPQR